MTRSPARGGEAAGELLPCPFCGGEARAGVGSALSWVACTTPGCDGEQSHYALEAAIAAWNTRTDAALAKARTESGQ